MSPVASGGPGTPPPSQIPVAVKRASATPGSRTSTPPPPSSRASLASPRSDDAEARHANIRSMHTALVASHARSQELTAALLGESPGTSIRTPGSVAGGTAFSPGLLHEYDDDELSLVGDEDRVRAPTQSSLNKMRQKAIPHSSPMYDLRRRAATPSENGTPQRDDRLGLSRIPRATVTHAVSLHSTSPAASPTSFRSAASPTGGGGGGGGGGGVLRSPYLGTSPGTSPAFPSPGFPSPYSDGGPSPSPGARRVPSGGSASTRVIDDLQTQLQDSATHVLKLRQEAKNSRRAIEAVEDMKDKRDRMQVELNTATNVVARKERQNQELLQRARAAETELQTHRAESKTLERDTKRAVADAQTEAAEALAARERAEAEYEALRDSVKSLRDVWAREVGKYRAELEARDEAIAKGRTEAQEKHTALIELVRSQADEVARLVEQADGQSRALAERFEAEVGGLRAQLEASDRASEQARDTAAELALELQRLRRLMRSSPRADLDSVALQAGADAASPVAVPAVPTTDDRAEAAAT